MFYKNSQVFPFLTETGQVYATPSLWSAFALAGENADKFNQSSHPCGGFGFISFPGEEEQLRAVEPGQIN